MNIKLNHTEAVQNVLKGLSEPLKKQVLKKALVLLSKPILDSARSKVWNHQRKGRLYRSLGYKTSIVNGNPLVLVGARKKGKFRGSHAHFLEGGTKERFYITKKGVRKSTGRVRGIKYWSSSIVEGTAKGENEFTSYIFTAIEKEANSLYRKAKKNV